MKKYIFLVSVLTLFFSIPKDPSLFACESHISLGNPSSNKAWVYLSGLTIDFYSDQEIKNRKILDRIGKKLNISFIALKPNTRCKEYNNMLCWPHNSPLEALKTYKYILSKNMMISGLIGFSNGGFFLNKLAQLYAVKVPIISVGAGGYFESGSFSNDLYLIIGKKDIPHYNLTKDFYEKSKNSHLHTTLIEHEGGHELHEESLENFLKSLIEKNNLN